MLPEEMTPTECKEYIESLEDFSYMVYRIIWVDIC